MTVPQFRQDAYLRNAPARVMRVTDEGGIVLDSSLFYPTSGGQPGDSGHLRWGAREIAIATTIKSENNEIILIPAEPMPLPPPETAVSQHLNWERRHRHMRVHTALHLLSVVIPLPVSGGSISSDYGRLDFDMPDAPADKDAIESAINALIDQNLAVTDEWITDADLDANPGLVKTMSVAPPRGTGQIRLVRIGAGDATIDLQPCGGTHVRFTHEIGSVTLGKIEKKGKQNRRVYLHLS